MKAPLVGAALVVLYTGLMTAADGITKFVAGSYAAPQVLALSAMMIAALSLGFASAGGRAGAGGQVVGLKVQSVGVMGLRTLLTIIATLGFFYAFKLLPFADVFLFVGLIPLVAAVLSGPVLNERPRLVAWIALCIGVGGCLMLMPGGLSGFQVGHFAALVGVFAGTGSMLAARVIAKVERVPLAQVFWPNLGLAITMCVALPFVWAPISLVDLGFIAAYSLALFFARYVVVEALRLLPTYVATPLMNLQFVWMVIVGMVFFNETPALATILGAGLVISSGLWLVFDEHSAASKSDFVPAE
ncbi:MAG: DMT family transporter [Pelagimonas sp.]|jgi:S-adenosylmethionine uptake transporter|nr:DMT family transporter [Pelagimonas sp.]